MRFPLFTLWLAIDSHRKPTPAQSRPCSVCPEEDDSIALLIDPGIEEGCATYRCGRDAWHVMVYPHYLEWPSYRANMWITYQKASIRAFFTCTFPWHLRRMWRNSVDATFLMLYRLAYDCMGWSIRTMRRDREGNIVGHTLCSRGIAVLQALLFAIVMPHMEKQARRRGVV